MAFIKFINHKTCWFKKTIVLVLMAFTASGCAPNNFEALLSPCVSTRNGACERIPVNDHWLKKEGNEYVSTQNIIDA